MFPLSSVLFPHAELPLHVFEPRYRELTDHCLAGDREFGVVLIARGSEVGGGDQRYDVGTVAHIEAASRFDDGRWALLARGTRRFTVSRWLPDAPYPLAEVEERPEAAGARDTAAFDAAAAAVRRARTLLSELGSAAPVAADPDPGLGDEERLWRLCAMAPVTALDRQRLLESDAPEQRLAVLADLCQAVARDLLLLLSRGGGTGGGGDGGDGDGDGDGSA